MLSERQAFESQPADDEDEERDGGQTRLLF